MNTAKLRTSTRASGFTLIELLVVISIIFILAGMLFPALIQAKARGKQAKCINRCKQMNIAIQFYADEFQGYFPLDGRSPQHLQFRFITERGGWHSQSDK